MTQDNNKDLKEIVKGQDSRKQQEQSLKDQELDLDQQND